MNKSPETDARIHAPKRFCKTPVNCPHCGQLWSPITPEAAPGLYPASRRRWLHISHFRPKGRKTAHSAAPPLPTEPASLGFGGSPVVLATSAKRGQNCPTSLLWGWDSAQPRKGAHSGLCGANAGRLGWGAITTLGSYFRLSNCPGAGIRTAYFPVHALCLSPAGMNWMPSFSAFALVFCCAAARSAFANCRS